MGEPREDGGLAKEAGLGRRERLGASRRWRDDAAIADRAVAEQLLQRHRPVQPAIVSGVRDTEAATAQGALHHEPARLQHGTPRQFEGCCVRRRGREIAHRRLLSP